MTPAATAMMLACATWASTGLGGVAALRYRDRMHLLLGFSAGAVLGLVFFDLIPETFELAHERRTIALATATGFLGFFALERISAFHRVREHGHAAGRHDPELGTLEAAGLCVHSFFDGVAIGVAFQADPNIGIVVAFGIIAHDFNDDGLNTVAVVLAHGDSLRRSVAWLLVDMIAPVLGAAVTALIDVPPRMQPWMLGFFAGVFLYIGAADLLPEAREHDSPLVGVATPWAWP